MKKIIFSFLLFALPSAVLLAQDQKPPKDYACERAVARCQAEADKIEKETGIAGPEGAIAMGRDDMNRCYQILNNLKNGNLVVQHCEDQSSLARLEKGVKELREKAHETREGMCSADSFCQKLKDFYKEWF